MAALGAGRGPALLAASWPGGGRLWFLGEEGCDFLAAHFCPPFILFQNMSENLKDCLIQTQASLGEMVTIKTEACSPRRDQEYGQPWYAAELWCDIL